MLSERQTHLCNKVHREVSRNGGWVISWPDSKRVRFETLTADVGEQLATGFRACGMQVYSAGRGERGTPWGLMPTEIFEVRLPPDPKPDPQSHWGQLASGRRRLDGAKVE